MMPKRFSKRTVAYLLVTSLTISSLCLSSAQAQRLTWRQRFQHFISSIVPGTARYRRRSIGLSPDRNSDGGSRDHCPEVEIPLTALVPTDEDGLAYVESTISGYPTFWFYVPYENYSLMDRDSLVEFALLDEDGRDIYIATFPRPLKAGITRIQLPQTLSPLEEGKIYRWIFSVICNPNNRAGDATVKGRIQRVALSPEFAAQLEQHSSKERILDYASQEVWYEMLAVLIAQRQKSDFNDPELEAAWESLLIEINLEKLINQPIVPCEQSMMCVQTRTR